MFFSISSLTSARSAQHFSKYIWDKPIFLLRTSTFPWDLPQTYATDQTKLSISFWKWAFSGRSNRPNHLSQYFLREVPSLVFWCFLFGRAISVFSERPFKRLRPKKCASSADFFQFILYFSMKLIKPSSNSLSENHNFCPDRPYASPPPAESLCR